MPDSVARRLALILLALAGCSDEPAPPLRIGTLVWPAAQMAVREHITAERFLKSLGVLRIPGCADNLKLLAGPDPPLARSGRRLMEVMFAERLLRAPTEVDALFAPAPLEALEP